MSRRDYAYVCHCGSVNFSIRADGNIECNKCCAEVDEISVYPEKNIKNKHAILRSDLRHFSSILREMSNTENKPDLCRFVAHKISIELKCLEQSFK